MTISLIITVLLYVAVATALLSTIGLVVMKGVNEKLHYMAPPATVSVVLIASAIVLEEGWSQGTTKTILCALAVLLMNPILTHATARAARIREFGHWVSQPREREGQQRQTGD